MKHNTNFVFYNKNLKIFYRSNLSLKLINLGFKNITYWFKRRRWIWLLDSSPSFALRFQVRGDRQALVHNLCGHSTRFTEKFQFRIILIRYRYRWQSDLPIGNRWREQLYIVHWEWVESRDAMNDEDLRAEHLLQATQMLREPFRSQDARKQLSARCKKKQRNRTNTSKIFNY